VWNLWNGINANCNIDSENGTLSSHDIAIFQQYMDNENIFGSTKLYAGPFEVPDPDIADWDGAVINLNSNPISLPAFHEDLQSLIVLHEIGHSLGLAHVQPGDSSSTCVMQQFAYYAYPQTTSHDRKTLNYKYGG
jgi:hypothetical protein